MDFEKQISDMAAILEKSLDENLPVKNNYQKDIYEAMRYSLLGGGKRIRGILTLVCCRLAGGSLNDALPYAMAIEMIHAYSLIHDDLPCMDNDDMRRGKPTNHIIFGEDMAVLAGDALLGYAYELILTTCKNSEKNWRALKTIAVFSGTEGMLGGQIVDMKSEGETIDYEKIVYLQEHKTGALLKCACKTGGIIGGADEKLLDILELYAQKIGLAFQIKDDILDVEGNSILLGKTIGSDEKSEKSTFVSLCGINSAKQKVKELSEEAAKLTNGINEYGDFLSWIAMHLSNRKK